MTTKAQQIELDNALVAPENRRVIGKCNMRINPGMKPKEPTYQVALDALALTTCYPAFLITAEVHVIYMHQFWAIVVKHKSSYQFKINKKRFSVNVEVFKEILNICPKVLGKAIDELPTEEEALSFIRELGHTREIKYITDVIIDNLHQPWRTFASIINKCLRGKVSGLDKNQLLRVQILWGMYYKKNLDFVALIWEDLAYHIDNIDSKKQNKMKSQKKLDSAISSEEFPSKKKSAKAKKVVAPKPKPTKKKTLRLPKEARNRDTKMTDADQGGSEQQNVSQELGFEQVEEDAHVTLTLILDTQKANEPIQSSSVSSDFTSKLLNLENPSPGDNKIASLMETSARHAMVVPKITSAFTKTIPHLPLFFNPLPQQATPTPTPTTSEATTSFPSLLDFSYVIKFNDRVTNLEKDLSEIKQVDQYAQALSSIPAIVNRYINNKLRDAINKAIQAHNLDYRQEAQDEKNEYIRLVDTSIRTIIKEEVTTQLPRILP
ncbi:hypothetical protein Tco_1462662 [Tanacetum coccineum]